jgi:hypothetical protein
MTKICRSRGLYHGIANDESGISTNWRVHSLFYGRTKREVLPQSEL